MANLETVEKVTSEAGLKSLYDRLGGVEQKFVHGDEIELYYEFSLHIPLLRTIANNINSSLESKQIPKWAGASTYATAELDNHILRVRFKEGSPWIGIVFAIVMGLISAVLIWLILGEIRKKLKDIVPDLDILPGQSSYVIAGAVGLAVIVYFATRS